MSEYLFKHLFVGDSGKDVIFLGYRLNLTPAEYRIIKIIAEKGRAGTEEIYTEFKKSLTKGNVAVHICAINRKAAFISERRLIEYTDKCYFFNEFM